MNLADLRRYRQRFTAQKHRYFQDWSIRDEQREACWQNLASTLAALIDLGPQGTTDAATELLRRCIENFNELDTGFICTIEREELCDLLYEIGNLCGLDSEEDWVDQWRDW